MVFQALHGKSIYHPKNFFLAPSTSYYSSYFALMTPENKSTRESFYLTIHEQSYISGSPYRRFFFSLFLVHCQRSDTKRVRGLLRPRHFWRNVKVGKGPRRNVDYVVHVFYVSRPVDLIRKAQTRIHTTYKCIHIHVI